MAACTLARRPDPCRDADLLIRLALRRRSVAPRERIMAMASNDVERLIRARIPSAEVTIRDLAGDSQPYSRP